MDGNDAFLAIENKINASIDVHNSIIATGGSVIYGKEAMEHLKSIGTVVYLSTTGVHRYETTCLEDGLISGAIYYEVFDYGECAAPPRLDNDLVTIFEVTHVELAGGNLALRAVCVAVDTQRASTADTLTAVVVECYGLFTLVDELVVEDVEHLQERAFGRDIFHNIGLEFAFCFGVWLAPDFKC